MCFLILNTSYLIKKSISTIMKRQIVNETPEDKKKRKQEASRKSSAEHRARETPEERETRLTKNRDSIRIRRANATVLETEVRLETERIRSRERV